MLSTALNGSPSASGLADPTDADAKRFALIDPLRFLLVALGAGTSYYVGAVLGLAFGYPATQMAVLWPPIPVLVTALLLIVASSSSAAVGGWKRECWSFSCATISTMVV